jgi:Cu-processing system ATP-binding protein
VIRVEGLCKRFGRLDVLRDLSLTVAPGRITAVIGPNGSGKTTLIKAVLGLVRPDAGTITIGGEPLNGDWRYRAAIGYMPQLARFPDNLTGREVLAMLRALRQRPGATDGGLIEAFGLEPELDKRLHTLSAGTRQKMNAVAAFLFDAPLLILDEPTVSLDPVASGVLKDRIHAARDAGRTVVLSSHIMAEVEELADDLGFLLDGSLRYAGPVRDLLADTGAPTLERAIAQLMRDHVRGRPA